MIHWGDIRFLHGLWAMIPALVLLRLLWSGKERRLAQMIDPDTLARLVPYRDARREWRVLLRYVVAAGLIIMALARPQWGAYLQEVAQRGLDVMVVFDTSNSMLAEDLRPNRLQQAKWAVRDLTEALEGDRVGLVAFAGEAHLVCPPTSDYTAFRMNLNDLYAGIVGRGGTQFKSALETAIDSLAFSDAESSDAVIVLITDGEDHSGDLDPVVRELQNRGIRVFAVGIGTQDGELIPLRDEHGRVDYLRDGDGLVVKSRLQEALLQALAAATDGMYVRARPGDFGMDRIIEHGLAPLQRGMLEERQVRMYRERFGWFLALAFLLLMMDSFPRKRMVRAHGGNR